MNKLIYASNGILIDEIKTNILYPLTETINSESANPYQKYELTKIPGRTILFKIEDLEQYLLANTAQVDHLLWLIFTWFLYCPNYQLRLIPDNSRKRVLFLNELQRVVELFINGNSEFNLLLRGWIKENRKMKMNELIDHLVLFYNSL